MVLSYADPFGLGLIGTPIPKADKLNPGKKPPLTSRRRNTEAPGAALVSGENAWLQDKKGTFASRGLGVRQRSESDIGYLTDKSNKILSISSAATSANQPPEHKPANARPYHGTELHDVGQQQQTSSSLILPTIPCAIRSTSRDRGRSSNPLRFPDAPRHRSCDGRHFSGRLSEEADPEAEHHASTHGLVHSDEGELSSIRERNGVTDDGKPAKLMNHQEYR
jgi:hypothetical protein